MSTISKWWLYVIDHFGNVYVWKIVGTELEDIAEVEQLEEDNELGDEDDLGDFIAEEDLDGAWCSYEVSI